MQCSGFWVGVLLGLFNFAGIIENPWSDFFQFQGEAAGKIRHFIEFLLLIFTSGVWISGVSVVFNTLLITFAKMGIKWE
jgi:hypothetical protein